MVAVLSGLVGGAVWFTDLVDRSDGDDLRWGFWHNPFMRFEPFHEGCLDASMWVLLLCAACAGLGGLLLLAGRAGGARFVVGQAVVSIAVHAVVVVAIGLAAAGVVELRWAAEALLLRLGAIAVNGALWSALRSPSADARRADRRSR
ncbi:MAG: hypothetical protein ACON4Z_12520 [Planctomycetota bacterium]